ncbi:MAG: rhodanese-like domain-containing protein [bacterium]
MKNISAKEAKALLDSDEDYVYIDVRSEFQFEQHHPADAYNIPLKQLNRSTQMLEDNLEFVEVFQANFPKDGKLILGCATGPRSMFACQLLAQLGYEDLSNVNGGFSGIRDMSGAIIKEGWMQLGFPTEQGDGGERGYHTLKGKLE